MNAVLTTIVMWALASLIASFTSKDKLHLASPLLRPLANHSSVKNRDKLETVSISPNSSLSSSDAKNQLNTTDATTALPLTQNGSLVETTRQDFNSEITVFSRGTLLLFHNGRKLLSITSTEVARKKRTKKILLNMKDGDVLAASSSANTVGGSRVFGVAMQVTYKGVKHEAGESVWYKAEAVAKNIDKRRKYKEKRFNSCSWRLPRELSVNPNVPHARKLVWASRHGKYKNGMLLRFVVSGESCSGATYCKCQAVPNVKSFCFEMIRKSSTVGRCKKKKCDDKYECITSGEKNMKTCILRYARFKVTKKGVLDGRRICWKVKLEPVEEFWVPYS